MWKCHIVICMFEVDVDWRWATQHQSFKGLRVPEAQCFKGRSFPLPPVLD